MDASQKRPTAGVRYVLVRGQEEASGATYRGFAHLPEVDLPLEIHVEPPSEGGAEGRTNVTARLEGAPEGVDALGLEKAGVALVKAALRAARDAGRPMPRRIVRWRGPA
ncbi:hypothetical protein [Polyangium spumosum]|uniref:Uncharacterized protein n=1 Tax=Polyangium spumosum TaxID=889282 RepID=A0A6N7PEU9_9BACT|nr:hypothetical protein [Polyangium spumosum]MRG90602.1 hypothetical protein [Polyangium spumosum]